MFRFIVMTCGYVESAMTSALIYQCGFFGNPGYSSSKEAITDLALDMYAKYYDDHLSIYERRYSKDVKDCCRKALIDDNKANYCAQCGSQIQDREFDEEEFMEYVTSLHSSTCDSYGDAEDAGGRHLTWWPYWNKDFIGAPKEEVIYIGENAESLLCDALFDAKPELRPKDWEETPENSLYTREWDKFKKDSNYNGLL